MGGERGVGGWGGVEGRWGMKGLALSLQAGAAFYEHDKEQGCVKVCTRHLLCPELWHVHTLACSNSVMFAFWHAQEHFRRRAAAHLATMKQRQDAVHNVSLCWTYILLYLRQTNRLHARVGKVQRIEHRSGTEQS